MNIFVLNINCNLLFIFKIMLFFILIFCIFNNIILAQDKMQAPWDDSDSLIKENNSNDFSFIKFPLLFTIKFYQNFISSARGYSCPMYPSCSHYGYIAFKKHGTIKGYIMIADRLIRCGKDLRKYKIIIVNNQYRFIDLIEDNEFVLKNSSNYLNENE